MKIDLTRETEVQRAVVHVYEAFGCEVIRFSEGRKSRITPGWPDLSVFHVGKGVFFLHETKRPGGEQSAAQSHLQWLAERCHVPYVLGGVHEAQAQLRNVGLLPKL